jgi:hypothetical protein
MVYYGTLISSLILLLMALILPVRNFYKGRTVDLMIMAVTCTMASPIAWEHHYGILLPVFAYLLPQLIGVRGWVPYVLLGVSYFLCSNYFDFLKATALTPWNLFQSYLLFGAFLLLIFLYRISSVREFRIAKEH